MLLFATAPVSIRPPAGLSFPPLPALCPRQKRHRAPFCPPASATIEALPLPFGIDKRNRTDAIADWTPLQPVNRGLPFPPCHQYPSISSAMSPFTVRRCTTRTMTTFTRGPRTITTKALCTDACISRRRPLTSCPATCPSCYPQPSADLSTGSNGTTPGGQLEPNHMLSRPRLSPADRDRRLLPKSTSLIPREQVYIPSPALRSRTHHRQGRTRIWTNKTTVESRLGEKQLRALLYPRIHSGNHSRTTMIVTLSRGRDLQIQCGCTNVTGRSEGLLIPGVPSRMTLRVASQPEPKAARPISHMLLK